MIAREELVEALMASAAETAALAEVDTVSAPASVPGSIVPSRRQGLPVSLLAPDYERILDTFGER